MTSLGKSGSGLIIAGTNLGLVGQLREVGEEPGDELGRETLGLRVALDPSQDHLVVALKLEPGTG